MTKRERQMSSLTEADWHLIHTNLLRVGRGEQADKLVAFRQDSDATREALAQERARAEQLDVYKRSGPYEAKAFDIVAESLETLKPEEIDARMPKLVAVVRNGAEWIRRIEQRAEQAEQARDAAQTRADGYFAPVGDNHHNAEACPYCNPKREALSTRLRALEGALKTLSELAYVCEVFDSCKDCGGNCHTCGESREARSESCGD